MNAKRALHSLTFYNPEKTYNGFTLFTPLLSDPSNTWLIDMRGRLVHRWQLPGWIRMHAELLPNGNLLFAIYDPKSQLPELVWAGGEVLEMDWDGNIVWRYKDPYMDSHDRCRLKNGNTMVFKFVEVPKDIAAKVKGGVPGTERKGTMWGNALQEITPGGKVAWEWLTYEHLDPEKTPLIPEGRRFAWPGLNSVVELSDGNIMICSFGTSNVYIIDKATGDIKWMWGYATAEKERDMISYPHNPTMLDNGNILLLDNGRYGYWRQGYSRVIEVNPSTNEIEWEYDEDNPTDFFTRIQGSVQRFPNGNTLICESVWGRFFEITPRGETVWEYISPFYGSKSGTIYGRISNHVYRCIRYGPDYPGLQGKKLDIGELDLWNRLYGPDAFRPGAEPTPRGLVERAPIEEEKVPMEKEAPRATAPPAKHEESRPSVAQPGKETGISSRLRLLGY